MKALFRFLLVPCLLFPVAVYSALVNNFLMEGRTAKQAIATEYLLFLFLYLYCRYLAPRHRALTEAFIYAFALPFSVLLTLMSAVFILDGRTTSPPKDLLAFAQWIIDFVADPISEMFALAGVAFVWVCYRPLCFLSSFSSVFAEVRQSGPHLLCGDS